MDKPNPTGMDGWRRNIEKMKLDAWVLGQLMPEHVARFKRKPWSLHAYVNLFVESERNAPYLMGHIWSAYLPVSVGAILALTIKVL